MIGIDNYQTIYNYIQLQETEHTVISPEHTHLYLSFVHNFI
jgi:hypothetical protein